MVCEDKIPAVMGRVRTKVYDLEEFLELLSV